MSFNPDTEKLAKELIQAEYENACKQAGQEFNDEYTDKYHSLYEGYAVLLEEVEEVEEEMDRIKEELSFLWVNLKCSGGQSIEQNLDILQNFTQNAIKELAQVGAVFKKIQNTIGEVKEKNK